MQYFLSLCIVTILQFTTGFRRFPSLTTHLISYQRLSTHTKSSDIRTDEVFLRFDSMSIPEKSLTSFLTQWTNDQLESVGTGTISSKILKNGAIFYFLPSPGSYVQIMASYLPGDIVEMRKQIYIRTSTPQIESLLMFASQNLLDSFANDLEEVIHQRLVDIQMNQVEVVNSNEIPSEESSLKLNEIIEIDERDIDVAYLERHAKEWKPDIPTEEELMELMVSSSTSSTTTSEDNSTKTRVTPTLPTTLTSQVIHSWSGDNLDMNAATAAISLWSDKFSNRGAGLSCKNINGGIEVSFTIKDDVTTQYIVQKTSTGLDVVSISPRLNDDNESQLIGKAISNLDTNLSKYLSTVSVYVKQESVKTDLEPVLESDLFDQSVAATSKQPSVTASSRSYQAKPMKSDAATVVAAKEIGLNMEKFEGKGIEDQALEQLKAMVDSTRKEGFLSVIKAADVTSNEVSPNDQNMLQNDQNSLQTLFSKGSNISRLSWEDMLNRKYTVDEDLSKPPTKVPMDFTSAGLEKGIDIFEGPPMEIIGKAPLSSIEGQVTSIVEALLPPDTKVYVTDLNRMQLLLNELRNNPEERHSTIIDSFKELLLCDNFLFIMKELNATQTDSNVRSLCAKVVDAAKVITAELGALAKTESIRHLETIYDVCEISAKYQQDELKFLEQLDRVKPRFDTAFFSYLRFAIEEERKLILTKGSSDPDRLPSVWLQVLTVIYRGVQAEFEMRFDRVLEPLLLTVRFEQPEFRSELFQRFINITQPLELYYMRELAMNMANTILSQNEADMLDSTLHTKMTQLLYDIDTYLSEEIIEDKIQVFAEEAKRQGKKIVVRHRNPVMQLEADLVKEYGDIDDTDEDAIDVSPGIIDRKST